MQKYTPYLPPFQTVNKPKGRNRILKKTAHYKLLHMKSLHIMKTNGSGWTYPDESFVQNITLGFTLLQILYIWKKKEFCTKICGYIYGLLLYHTSYTSITTISNNTQRYILLRGLAKHTYSKWLIPLQRILRLPY